MDPNTALIDLRDVVKEMGEAVVTGEGDLFVIAAEAADRFRVLDEWLSKGGFAPSDWTPTERNTL